jgi:hypothetical protein
MKRESMIVGIGWNKMSHRRSAIDIVLMGLIGGSSIGVVVRQPIASCGFVGVAAGLGFYLVDKHGVIGFVKSQIPGGAKPSDE